ncbi:MAG: tetraacyldisaccharide 4'-kinase [Thermodesulfobacteriaceae bacterium]|nr:tetraacyldisaccharide 4'-kinase [Thermodesulfobacteriaceae bacterium]MCX8041273.1 tetraacyldisaccharide 4'-kinase [Thermodesulfobacteriaceae bacterium]MDW8135432.1 tetraacyldisaccharide 4'-kinase [Thermodesulfobacterium sp.]
MLKFLNPYFYFLKARNFAYQVNLFKSYQLEVPVISVGNLSLGGTGKTSLIRFLCEKFSLQYHVVVLSRGYKRKSKGTLVVAFKGKLLENWEKAGDEPYLLAKIAESKGLKVSVVVDEDRVRGGKLAVKELQGELILLDDGFQHLRLKRNLNLVLIKKKDLKESLFPWGRLREPLKNLERADAIILSYQELEPFNFKFKNKPIFKLYRKDWKVINWKGESISNYKDQEFLAFCGLGDNQQFLKTLKHLGIKIKKFLSFPDHYHYRNFQLLPHENYITTLKDGIKFNWSPNLYFLDYSIEVKGLLEFINSKL